MAFGKVFPKRLFESVKKSLRVLVSPKLTSRCHYLTSPESSGFLHHFLEVRSVCGHFGNPSLSMGDRLTDIRTVDLDVNHPTARDVSGIFIHDARKILRESQMQKVKAKLRDIPHTSIYYSHYFQICLQYCGHSQHQATVFAETLNHSGDVIVFGDVVFLRP